MPCIFRKFCQIIGIIGIALLPDTVFAQQTAPTSNSSANEWVKFGIENVKNGDLDAAISAFESALKADPKWAPAYECRGRVKTMQNKFDEAIADYDQTIQIDPNYQDAYYDRGVAKAEKGDLSGALADFNRTLELNPQYSQARYNRGHVEYFKGDLDAAIADLSQALTLDPNSPYICFIRGLARLGKDDREGAATDFQQSATNGYAPAAFWLWIVKMKHGDHSGARSSLSDFVAKPQLFKPDGWETQIGNFLLEKTTQDDLMVKAKAESFDDNAVSEAWFYIGIYKHFSGDTPGALNCFQQAIATGSKISEISVEAQREVARLQKS